MYCQLGGDSPAIRLVVSGSSSSIPVPERIVFTTKLIIRPPSADELFNDVSYRTEQQDDQTPNIACKMLARLN